MINRILQHYPHMARLITIILLAFSLLSCSRQKKDAKLLPIPTMDSASIKLVENIKAACSYDNPVSTLGIGLVISPTEFKIFNDSLLTSSFGSWNMYNDEDSLTFCSKFHKPDYGIMHFVCISKTPNAYKVLVNYSDIKYLPIEKDYTFTTWEKYILQSFGIRRINDSDSGSLKKEPSDNADTLSIPKGYEMFCVIKMRDDWMKVTYDCFYNLKENKHEGEPCQNFIHECKAPVTGWLRWRKDNTCLVDIFLMP